MVDTPGVDTAKLFTNGRSQAVRLPKDYRFEGNEVMVTRLGAAVVLLPKNHDWNVLFDSLSGFSGDFMSGREQPPMQERDTFGGS